MSIWSYFRVYECFRSSIALFTRTESPTENPVKGSTLKRASAASICATRFDERFALRRVKQVVDGDVTYSVYGASGQAAAVAFSA